MSYVLSCCSTADLTRERLLERDISYICFSFSLDGVTYPDDMGVSVPFADFYKAMDEGAETKTAQINISEYLDYFTKILQSGKDILHVSLSSGLSGSYNSAVNAANIARERFPDRKIYIVDSLGASSGYGLFMDLLADKRDEGADIDTLYGFAQDIKLSVHHWFFSTDLKFYIKGGRVSKTSGAIATVLGICPLLHMDKEGHLIPKAKIRTKKKVINEIVSRMEMYAENGTDYSGKCYISHSACIEDAKAVSDLVTEKFKNLKEAPRIYDIGTTIGSHAGPGTVALFFIGAKRDED